MLEDVIDLIVFIAFVALLYFLIHTLAVSPLEKEALIIEDGLNELRYDYILSVYLKTKVGNETMLELMIKAKENDAAWERWKNATKPFLKYFKDTYLVLDEKTFLWKGDFYEGFFKVVTDIFNWVDLFKERPLEGALVTKKFVFAGEEHYVGLFVSGIKIEMPESGIPVIVA